MSTGLASQISDAIKTAMRAHGSTRLWRRPRSVMRDVAGRAVIPSQPRASMV